MALIGSLTSGVSGLQSFSKDLEVIGNNIANVNTTAFKSGSLSFAESFSNTLRASQPGTGGTSSNVQASQIGSGVTIAGVNVNYNQGALSSTGQATDLGISGEGFFLVNDGNGTTYATRDGTFRWDNSGTLVNASGMKVQGLAGSVSWSGTTPTAGTLGTKSSDIKMLTTGLPAGVSLQSVSIDRSGNVVQMYSNGTSANVGQVLLQQFSQPTSLMKNGDGLYSSLSSAGPKGTNGLFTTAASVTAADYTAGGSGNGTIEAGTLEQSNVDLTSEFANMITAQRSFQANARVVTVSDTLLDDIVNLKR
jgi:flagellar hook protein FlgE